MSELTPEESARRMKLVQMAGAAVSQIFDSIHVVDWLEIDSWIQNPEDIDRSVQKTHQAFDRLQKELDLISFEVRSGLL